MTAGGPFRVRRWPGARSFRERAGPWLLQREAEHNVLLGILDQLETDPSRYDPPVYLATVEGGGGILGCAFRTPPHKLGLTRMPLDAVDAVVRDVAEVYEELPAVLATEETAVRFGESWAAQKGVAARPGMRQRLYMAERVIPPPRPTPGAARQATLGDMPLLVRWIVALQGETGLPGRDPERAARERVTRGAFRLWEDGGRPVSLAGWPARGTSWARVGYVYTPPKLRRRGYATNLVAELTASLLAEGCRYTVLYTDLSNPTSNAIYQDIGYRPVMDIVDVDFVSPSDAGAGAGGTFG